MTHHVKWNIRYRVIAVFRAFAKNCIGYENLFTRYRHYGLNINFFGDCMRILHTMLRVGDLDKSIAFYSSVLGMNLIRQSDNEEYKYTLAFLGYGDESDGAVLELTYNWGVSDYDLGSAYGHIAIEVDDAYTACEKIKKLGGVITRDAGPVKGGSTIIAFVKDPDGYSIELIQKKDMKNFQL